MTGTQPDVQHAPPRPETATTKVRGAATAAASRARASLDRRLCGVSQKFSLATAVLVCATPLLLVHARAPDVASQASVNDPPAAVAPIEIVKTRPLPASAAAPAVPQSKAAATPAPAPAAIPAPPSPTPTVSSPTPQASPPVQASPPPPDTWREAEIAQARQQCRDLLGPLAATYQEMPPIKQDKCGTPAPISLKRLGPAVGGIELTPPAVLNCAMVAKLSAFVDATLQPAAREAFGAQVVRFNQASGFVCRGRNGDAMANGKVSEHALANALDVASFTLADGRVIDVGKHWGPAARDFKNVPPLVATPAARALVGPGAERSALGVAPSKKGQAQAAHTPPDPAASKTKEALFLRRLHQGACTMFGTVLGPEANEAHREHFHFDLHPRRHSNYCQ